MLGNLNIKMRITMVMTVMIAMMFVLGFFGLYASNHSVAVLEQKVLRDKFAEVSLVRVKVQMELAYAQMLEALTHNPQLTVAKMQDHPVTVHLDKIAGIYARMNKSLDDYQKYRSDDSGEARLFDTWKEDTGGFGKADIDQVSSLIAQGKWDDAELMTATRVNRLFVKADKDAQAINSYLIKRELDNQKQADETLKLMNYLSVALMLLAVAVATVMGMSMSKSITAPLLKAVELARRVAAGDLTARSEVARNDEIGDLQRALCEMNQNLTRIVSEVRVGTESIASSSSEIASGNLDLSNRTEAQAGSLEETASAMEELTTAVRQNAENAQQANDLATKASDVAVRGGAVVSEVVQTMAAINDSARKIADIIGVIDGIAFQTNILALNAAVEAARAGEQGRGFAVVAAEVRSLAQRSANAAKEIKALIDDSVDKVETGNRQADLAGSTMSDVVSSIQSVAGIMSDITSASREQSTGIEQINRAISHMDETTQQNAALVEQAAAAAKSLQDQARNLEELVFRFKLEGQTGMRQAPRSSGGAPRVAHAAAGRPALARPRPATERTISSHQSGDEEWEEF